jgi:xanthine/uracil permease
MANFLEFLTAVLSHWIWLSMAVIAFLLSQFVDFGPSRKIVPGLIMFGIGCIIMAFYLAVSGQMTALEHSLHGS